MVSILTVWKIIVRLTVPTCGVKKFIHKLLSSLFVSGNYPKISPLCAQQPRTLRVQVCYWWSLSIVPLPW